MKEHLRYIKFLREFKKGIEYLDKHANNQSDFELRNIISDKEFNLVIYSRYIFHNQIDVLNKYFEKRNWSISGKYGINATGFIQVTIY